MFVQRPRVADSARTRGAEKEKKVGKWNGFIYTECARFTLPARAALHSMQISFRIRKRKGVSLPLCPAVEASDSRSRAPFHLSRSTERPIMKVNPLCECALKMAIVRAIRRAHASEVNHERQLFQSINFRNYFPFNHSLHAHVALETLSRKFNVLKELEQKLASGEADRTLVQIYFQVFRDDDASRCNLVK